MAVFRGTDGPNNIRGTSEADKIYGRGDHDTLTGLGGNDLINGGDGNDTIAGGSGRDTLSGGNGDDSISAGSGNDKSFGSAGEDFLTGAAGSDTLRGGASADTLNGGTQSDSLLGGGGGDLYNGYKNRIGNLAWGEDTINDISGNDEISLGEFVISDMRFTALDSDANGFIDVLRIDPVGPLSPNSIYIQNYFGNDSAVPEDSDAGEGLIENIHFSDGDLGFSDIQDIALTS